MGRWEPDGRGRLLHAAIDLFAEQGYDATTTAQIAERAGLTKTTFFRHFADKREVLFYGQPALIELADGAIAAAPAGVAPLTAVAAAVDALTGVHTDEQRKYALRLHAIVAAHAELRERSAFKRSSIVAAMARALQARGVAEPAAGLAAELGTRAYYTSFDRWIDPDNARPLPELGREALDELRAAIKSLD
jgi:AcrR family transcriptional regulator